jgi:hypothetical protein
MKRVVAKIKIGKKSNDEFELTNGSTRSVYDFWKSWDEADELERYDIIKPISKNLIGVAKLAIANKDKKLQSDYDHVVGSLMKSYLDDYGEYLRQKYKGDVDGKD